MTRKLICVWPLALVGSILLSVLTAASAFGGTYDAPYVTTTPPATVGGHTTAVETVGGGGADSYAMASGQVWSLLSLSNTYVAPRSGAKYVFDARTGQYREVGTGRFVSPRDLPWPGNRGFAGKPVDTTLGKGTIVDRYGKLSGQYAGSPGTSVSARGMASGSEGMAYTQLEVVKPVTVPGGPAAAVPAFGAAGGGSQYFFPGGFRSG